MEGSQPGSGSEDQRFSTVDMVILGGVLGALLLLALIGLVVLLTKHYGHQLHCCSSKAVVSLGLGSGVQVSKGHKDR